MREELKYLKDLFEDYMAGVFPEEGDEESRTLFEAMRYTLDAPGKRVRPMLLLLACKAVHGNEKEALPYACAIEFIHNYSLIHDDLPAMDNDDMRRGKLTNHKVFGEAMAILAGDGLLSAAFDLMHRDYLGHMNEPGRILAGAAITAGCGCYGMVAGQAADIEAEGNPVSAGLLDYIHKNKTAALIKAAVTAGAYIGGADEADVMTLSEYGECLGLAFQITDDILDYGTEEGKASFPAIHGLGVSCARLEELTAKAVQAALSTAGADPLYISILIDMAVDLAKRVE